VSILDALLIPGNTNWYQVCQVLLGIGEYCLVLESIAKVLAGIKVLSGITKYCQVSQSIVRYHKVFSGITKYCQVQPEIVSVNSKKRH
jgi:hypothetical protein